ncbi:MAG TPA: alpha/beta hydrolase [Vicinamibacterales bacterium]|nr:alpha/beta hydrolase [Vicinamibacterales bacterium]
MLPVVALLALSTSTMFAQAPDASRIRAAFLKMIDRPRVALAPHAQPRVDSGRYRAEQFSFASEAGERVPGIFLTSASAKDRRPVVIFLHGTGGRKEEFLATLRTFADRGFATAAIDARHHGARITRGAGNEQYYAAMMDTFRTGKGHPYLYDTVWDVLRLVDYLETRSDVDATRIGLMGISKGATEAYIAAAVDSRIAVTVPIIGVQGYRWALDNNQWQARVDTFRPAVDGAAHSAGATVDGAFVRRFYDRIVPGIYGDFDGGSMLSLVAPRPVLVINGDSDALTPLAGVQDALATARRTYIRMGAEDKLGLYLQPNAGHVVTPVAELVMADWFVRFLKP